MLTEVVLGVASNDGSELALSLAFIVIALALSLILQ